MVELFHRVYVTHLVYSSPPALYPSSHYLLWEWEEYTRLVGHESLVLTLVNTPLMGFVLLYSWNGHRVRNS